MSDALLERPRPLQPPAASAALDSDQPAHLGEAEPAVELPIGLLAEITHRCPLQCP